MQTVDLLLNARWVIPVEPDNVVLEHHSVAILDGKIVAIEPTVEAKARFNAAKVCELDHHTLIPGLINAHTHAAMSLMRGLADDLPLMSWLQGHIWPVEGRFIGPDFIRSGTRLAMAEMLRGGTTCFNDMYFFPDIVAHEAEHAGMRAVVGMILIDFPTAWGEGPDEYLQKGFALRDELSNSTLVTTAFAPHAPYSVSDEPLSKVAMYAEEFDIPIHMHIHETADEVEQGLAQHGNRPLERLAGLGLLSPQMVAVHMTQLTDPEIALIAENGCHVVHCPESNLKLASGFCPVDRLLAAGINVALGTDGAASNNDLDMLGEMRTAALLAKGVAGRADALPAHQALRMATLNGARALGIDAVTGSLEVGKAADIVAIRCDEIETQPLYHPVSQLVYASGRDKVTDVWVAGRRLLKNRQLTTLDETEVLEQARTWQVRIASADEEAAGE